MLGFAAGLGLSHERQLPTSHDRMRRRIEFTVVGYVASRSLTLRERRKALTWF